MYIFSRALRSATLFRMVSDRGIWRVTRNGHVHAAYWSEGDARRGACLGARRTVADGGSARVLSSQVAAGLNYNEPQFGR